MDYTVPKTVDTRKYYDAGLSTCTILLQPQKSRCRDGVTEDVPCSQPYLVISSCVDNFWKGVIPTTHWILMLSTLVSLNIPTTQ